jgi:signal transduction histidine kinase
MSAAEPSTSLQLSRAAQWLRPLIDRVAAVRASVHTKLRAGFIISALLLVTMAVASLAVQAHIAARVDELNFAEVRLDLLRQMYYLITAQSHYRTMSLLTHDDSYVQQIADAKAEFRNLLDETEQLAPDDERGFFARVREADQRFATSSQQVLGLYQAGQTEASLRLHLAQEHPISHEIEQPITVLLSAAEQQMSTSRATVESDQRLLSGLFIAFSVVSLVTALLFGYILSWSVLRPLDIIRRALAHIAAGRFTEHVDVVNRDEFGAVAEYLNTTSQELATMYGQLQALNAQLTGTNRELVAELQARVEELDRSRGMITEAEERLRRDIAEVLHSRVQNRLLTIWYRLEEIQDLVSPDSTLVRQSLESVRELVDEIRERDVRDISHRLHPSIIRAGLLPALEMLVDELPRVEVELRADESVQELDDARFSGIPETVRLTAYRVVEEALGNIIKHSGATHAIVQLRQSEAGLRLEIRDDGVGFETLRPGLGVSSMAARVGRLGGTWSISSTPGNGTCVVAVLPLSAQQMQYGVRAEIPLGQEQGAHSSGGLTVTDSL